MTLLPETEAPAPQKRGARGLWLLLVPPTLAVTLLLTAAVQPLQIGPYVLLCAALHSPGSGWRPVADHLPASRAATPFTFRNQTYRVTGEAWLAGLNLGDWQCGIVCFHGHRAR